MTYIGEPPRRGVLGQDRDGHDTRLPEWYVGKVALVVWVLIAAGVWIGGVLAGDAWRWWSDRSASSAERDPPPPRQVPPPDPAKAYASPHGDVAAAFSSDDYPAEALQRGEAGRVVVQLAVDRTGTPRRCIIQASSQFPRLDRATCRVALARVRYEPARDARGVAIASSVRLPVRWKLPDE